MNSYSRTMAAIYGEAYDRTPVIPLIIQHALDIAGIKHREYSSDGAKMAQAQLFALNNYGYDGLHISTDNQIISEALGCKVILPLDEPPHYASRILGENMDLKRLKIDFDPYEAGRMPVILNATTIVRERLKEEYFIKVNCDSGPFSLAAALRGEENFFMDLSDDEQYVFDLLEICTEAVIKYAKAIAGSGAHGITFGDSTSGLVGKKLYEKFALPFQKITIKEIKATGLPVFMHICGSANDFIDLMGTSGADVLEIDSLTDLSEAYRKTENKICFEGNIHPTQVILKGTPEDVYHAAKNCIKQSNGKRLILSSGCEVPRYSPKENIKAMTKAAKECYLN